MKKLIFAAIMFILSVNSFAQTSTYVNGYTRSNGTYVSGYHRTTPDNTRDNNFSTRGNVNPYNGNIGTKPGGQNSSAYNNFSTPSYPSTSSYTIPSYNSSPFSNSSSTYPTTIRVRTYTTTYKIY